MTLYLLLVSLSQMNSYPKKNLILKQFLPWLWTKPRNEREGFHHRLIWLLIQPKEKMPGQASLSSNCSDVAVVLLLLQHFLNSIQTSLERILEQLSLNCLHFLSSSSSNEMKIFLLLFLLQNLEQIEFFLQNYVSGAVQEYDSVDQTQFVV